MKNLTILTLDEPGVTDFAAARNKLLTTVKTPWVFFLDKDETITPALEREIDKAIHGRSPKDAYLVRRLDTFLGRELHHGETGAVTLLRLARAGWGRWERPVHEVWTPLGPEVQIGLLKNPLLHAPHPTITSFLDKINHYSTLEAKYRHKLGRKSSLFHIAIFPFAKFLQNYFLRLGFLDGTPGFIMAVMMGFHSYLTWTKLYLLWHKK